MFVIRKKCVSVAMARKNSTGAGRRVTPRRSPSASPTSHYASCKWTEPPAPSALPPPPQHWLQAPHSRAPVPFRQPQPPVDHRPKVLLKVQA